MKQLTAEECLARILKDVEKRRTVDYTDKNSVRRYNAAMDRIIKSANYFCDNYPDKMEMFTAFLDHSDYSVASTFTAILYGLHNSTRNYKLTALASARRLLLHPERNDLNELIWKVNIERWEAELLRSVVDE